MIELSVVNETGSALSAISPTKIKIIGCGGGGSSAVNRMIEAGVENVEFVVLNTDLQALNISHAQKRIAIGQKLTGGLGAGGNPQVGEDAAKEDVEMITNVVKGSDMVIITAGMGGGTGTGSAPIVAGIAREAGALTIAVVTTPFEFEGPVRMSYAMDGLAKLREQVDSLIVIPNQKVMKIAGADKKLNYRQAFRLADDTLCQGVQGISEIITKAGEINIDFADVKTVMKNQGEAILGVGRASGENRIQEVVQHAINNPMLENRTIDGAHNILINITGSDDLSVGDIETIINTISETAAPRHQVFWGQVLDPDMGDEIAITVIATGFVKEEEDTSFVNEPKEAVDDNVMSFSDFQGMLHGRTSVSSQDVPDSMNSITSTNPSNPGLFDQTINKDTFVPHENAPVDEDGKRSGTLGISLAQAQQPVNGKGILPPQDFDRSKADMNQPAVWRKLNGLSRTINLSED